MTTKKVDLTKYKKTVKGFPVKIKEQKIEESKTLALFKKAEKNATPLLQRDHVNMLFNAVKGEDDKQYRELVFDNGKVRIRTATVSTDDIKHDELECYKGMCLHVLNAIDEIE